tara:strand:- start:639 stop:956 length:318 start_codon:yes stop_codon:yes gene_type:complete
MTIKSNKLRNQVKSGFYYLFWGVATCSVVAGQIYVGTSHRKLSTSLDAWFDKTIAIMIQKRLMQPRGFYAPVPQPEDYDDDGVQFLRDLDPDDYVIWETISEETY